LSALLVVNPDAINISSFWLLTAMGFRPSS